jgi:curved DNA-binding protein
VEVSVSLEEAFRGTTRGIQIGRRTLEVKIPAGAQTGTRIHLSGTGARGNDVYLVIRVESHPKFERRGDDLHSDAMVDLYIMLLGGETTVTGLDGRNMLLTIPPETQSGRTFRLTGQGMPKLRNPNTRGDWFVKAVAELPTGLNDEEKRSFRELADRRKRKR